MIHRTPLYWLALGAIASVTLSSCVVSDGYAYREDYLGDGYGSGYYNRPISSGPDYYSRP